MSPPALEGKVALITGAARGVGEATARRFVTEGAQVVLADVRDDAGSALAAELGDAARYEHLDVTSETAWAAAVDHIRKREAHLEVLVNNAAILLFASLLETTPEQYLDVFRVNQLGPFLGMRAAAPLLIESGGGSIVNLSSTQGIEGFPGLLAYVSSKFAVRGMTKTVALELASQNVRVNSVHPTGIRTPMLEELGADRRGGGAGAGTRVPMGRLCAPEEVAAMILFLASNESSMCTGAEFLVDGGATAGPQ
jgi:3alpha(or 20beta)-hydroxysteroid dehydrogenase